MADWINESAGAQNKSAKVDYAAPGWKLVSVESSQGGIGTLTINAPPINIMTGALLMEIYAASKMMLTDPEIRVVIFRSAIPGYFMPHYNVGEIVQGMGGLSPISAIEDNILMSLLEEFRTGGKVTIAVIEGRAGGGGAETTYAMDMRFASEDAIFCQPEVAIGICPGAGASSRLARLIGRSRAMEMCLACDDIDAHTAEKWGVVNRTLPRDKIWPFVNNLAKRIASFPMHAIRETKRSVNQLEVYNGHAASVLGDQNMFRITVNEGMEVMRKFVEMGGDTPVIESRLGAACFEVQGQALLESLKKK